MSEEKVEKKYDLTERHYVYDDVLFAIDQFVEYPADYFKKLAIKIRMRPLSETELTQLIEFVRLDSYTLNRAIATGVHPITGYTAYTKPEDIARARRLIARNDNIISTLEKMKIDGGCDCE